MRRLAGQRALVTGGSRGIGLAIARALAAAGVSLHLVARSEAQLAAACAELNGATAHPLDLTDDGALAALAEALPPIDILVHNAGYLQLGSVAEAPLSALEQHYRLNVRAPYALTQRLLPTLVARRGQIAFINSGAGLAARANWSQYAMSKFALRALADSLRAEVAPKGVRVISLYPGRTASEMQRQVCAMEGERYEPERLIQPQDVAAALLAALQLPDSAQLTDITIRPARS